MELFSPNNVAKRLGVTPSRLRQMDEQLKPIRVVGGSRVYTLKNIDRVAGARDGRGRKKPVRK